MDKGGIKGCEDELGATHEHENPIRKPKLLDANGIILTMLKLAIIGSASLNQRSATLMVTKCTFISWAE